MVYPLESPGRAVSFLSPWEEAWSEMRGLITLINHSNK